MGSRRAHTDRCHPACMLWNTQPYRQPPVQNSGARHAFLPPYLDLKVPFLIRNLSLSCTIHCLWTPLPRPVCAVEYMDPMIPSFLKSPRMLGTTRLSDNRFLHLILKPEHHCAQHRPHRDIIHASSPGITDPLRLPPVPPIGTPRNLSAINIPIR